MDRTGRTVVTWTLAASTWLVACNAVFGLDGLTFEGGGAATPTTGGHGGTIASGGDAAGGDGGAGGSSGGTGGTGGAGGVVAVGPPSCEGLVASCGPQADEDCCASPMVPGGAFNRSNDPSFPATVSAFRLDRFEVTVGRFRRFVDAYPASQPSAGDGAHPLVAGSGWDPAWDATLPADAAALRASLACDPYATWTDAPAAQEQLPITCAPWALAFAFCAWDGGRLPTEAEWNFAAAGGDEQRLFPWGDSAPDATFAVYGCLGDGSGNCDLTDILAVGSRSPKGDGKSWGDGAHADLAGSMWEFVLDVANFGGCCVADYAIPNCIDCAALGSGVGPGDRVQRGGCFTSAPLYLQTTTRYNGNPGGPCEDLGGMRCARDL